MLLIKENIIFLYCYSLTEFQLAWTILFLLMCMSVLTSTMSVYHKATQTLALLKQVLDNYEPPS